MSVPIRSLKAGRQQTIEGRVVRLVDEDDFVLRDRTGSILVELDLDDQFLPLQSGQRVRVVGRLDRDDLDFDAQRVTRPNGSVLYDRLRPRAVSAANDPLLQWNDSRQGRIGSAQQRGRSDRLLGVAEDQGLVGEAGRDTLMGGDGSDRFVYQSIQPGHRILNFSASEDVIDLRPLFDRFEAISDQSVTDYLRVNSRGAHTQVQIDPDGRVGGRDFRTLVTLNHVSADTLTSQNFLI